MEKHRGEEGGQKNEIRDGDEDWDDNENGDNNNDDDEDDDEDDDDNDYYDDDKNADDEDADDEDADDDEDNDEDATDAKTTISCLYRLHDAASGCDILQTIWSICLSYTWRWWWWWWWWWCDDVGNQWNLLTIKHKSKNLWFQQ